MIAAGTPLRHGSVLPCMVAGPPMPQISRHARGHRHDIDKIAVIAFCSWPLAYSTLRSGQRIRRTGRHRCLVVTNATTATQSLNSDAPTDYYALLGIPAYTSDKKEIKAAHRRVVRLVHPDILGAASSDLQRIVNEGYRTLSDDETRKGYDAALRKVKLELAGVNASKWARDEKKGVFVDESSCAGCYKCVSAAPSTFVVDSATRKPYVDTQWADSKADIDIAVLGCPEKAISFVPRKFIPTLEFAMAKSRTRQGARPFDLLAQAHCRIVDLAQPKEIDSLESMSPAEELQQEYEQLTGDDSREVRDNILRKFKTCSNDDRSVARDILAKQERPALLKPSASGEGEKGVFVDETVCSRCYKCVDVASSTFSIHTSPSRNQKAYVASQDADAGEIVEMALTNCPSRAISYVPLEDVPLLELAMRESIDLQQRSNILTGPFDIFRNYIIDDIIRMDLELRQYSKQPSDSVSVKVDIGDLPAEISAAAQAIPADVRERLWQGIGGDEAALQKLMAALQDTAPDDLEDHAQANRSELKTELFKLLDRDGNGFLYSTELRGLAESMGFEGSDSDWTQDYVMLCTDFGCNPTEGLDFRGFSEMVDDEESGIDDADMADLLGR